MAVDWQPRRQAWEGHTVKQQRQAPLVPTGPSICPSKGYADTNPTDRMVTTAHHLLSFIILQGLDTRSFSLSPACKALHHNDTTLVCFQDYDASEAYL